MKGTLASLILLFATAVSAVGGPALASSAKGEPERLRWKSGAIKIYLSTSLTSAPSGIRPNSDVLGAVKNSLQAWSDVADVNFQIEISDKQSASPAGVAGDGISLISIATTPENILLFAKDSQTVSAKTRAFYNRRGQITEADIILNPFQQFSTDGSYGTFDLQSVLTHEIGHLLGLRHSGVIGSIMSNNVGKNDITQPGEFRSRQLAEPDAAAARDLYGTADILDDCCAIISGRLTSAGKGSRDLRVWIEDVESGRVFGQAEASVDGMFRMGGLTAGTYRVYARGRDSGSLESLGSIELAPTDEKDITKQLELEDGGISLRMIGTGGKLGESALTAARGTRSSILIGGLELKGDDIAFSVNSPYLHIDFSSQTEQESVAGITVMSFELAVDAAAPSGIYSVYATSGATKRSVLVGAIRVP